MREGWTALSLRDVATLVRGVSYKSSDLTDGAGVPLVNLRCVERGGGYRPEGIKWFTGAAKASQRAEPGDLLIANTDLTRGMAVVGCPVLLPRDTSVVGSVFSLDLTKLVVDTTRTTSAFLNLVLSQPAARVFMQRHTSGTTVMHLRVREVGGLSLLLPPLVEQRRIVDLVRALDDTLAAAGTALKRLDGLLLSLVEERVFAQGYVSHALGALALPRGLAGGPFGSDLTTRNFVAEGVPVLQGGNLTGAAPYVSGPFKFVSPEKATSLTNNLAVPGDVVVTQRGTLGQVALLPRDGYQTYVVSQSQMRLRVDPARVSSEYAYLALSSPRLVSEVVSQKIATANPHINLGIFSRLSIPVPPLAVQAEVVGLAFGVLAQRHATRAVAHATARLRSAVTADSLSGEHEIPASYDRFLDGAA